MTKISRARLSKDGLGRTPEPERTLFLALAHLQNELNFLHRAMIWSSDFSSTVEAKNQAAIAQSLFFVRLMAGKLKEGWELLQEAFFGAHLSKDFERNGDKHVLEALGRLKRFFNSANIIHQVRNGFAFHYSPSELNLALAATPDTLDVYLDPESNVNTLYYFAEVLANRAILQKTGRVGEAESMDHLIQQVGSVGKDFVAFCGGFMADFLDRYSDDVWSGKAEEVEIGALPQFRTVSFPFFFEVSEE